MHRTAFLLALLAHPVGAAPSSTGPFASVTTSCVRLSPERTYYVGTARRKTSVALEVVTTYRNPDDANVFARAVTPQLAVGTRVADEARITGKGTVTWWFYEPGTLVVGDPLRYGMHGHMADLATRHTSRCK